MGCLSKRVRVAEFTYARADVIKIESLQGRLSQHSGASNGYYFDPNSIGALLRSCSAISTLSNACSVVMLTIQLLPAALASHNRNPNHDGDG